MTRFLRLVWVPRLLAIVLASGLLGYAMASQAKSLVAPVNTAGGFAVKGYDPVAYFTPPISLLRAWTNTRTVMETQRPLFIPVILGTPRQGQGTRRASQEGD